VNWLALLRSAQSLASRVTVAASHQSEISCPEDWQLACAASHLTFNTNTGRWERTFQIPAGEYEYKVAIDNSRRSTTALVRAGGSNIALNLPQPPASPSSGIRSHIS